MNMNRKILMKHSRLYAFHLFFSVNIHCGSIPIINIGWGPT